MLGMNIKKKLKTSFEIIFSEDQRFMCHSTNTNVILFDNWDHSISINSPKNPSCVKFSRNNKLLIIKNTSGGLWIYDLENLKLLKRISSKRNFKLLDDGFGITENNRILDIMDTKNGNQIISVDVDTGDFSLLTNYENSQIKYNGFINQPNNKFHLFTLSLLNKITGYVENKIIKIKEPISPSSIEIISNSKVFFWDSLIYSSIHNLFILVDDYDLILMNMDFTDIVTKKKIIKDEFKEKAGYFMQIHLSNNEKYVVLTYSESILILRLDGLEQILMEYIPYLCFAAFSANDEYLLVGTWKNGFVLENNLE